ncbi:MAG TPA: metalloregulator ArsR/SmtB family transcription factor [Acidimicrobiales bacterium]|nr:metalloregulator ArsR/SmtB family transcription factor [Acidimicrobiales bacterium]
MESIEHRVAKDELFAAFASVAKALANGHRAEIVDLLAQGERPVEEVANEIDQSVANTSHHLGVLSGCGLVKSRRDGRHVFYRLTSTRVSDLWMALRDVAATHVANVEVLVRGYLGDRSGIEQISSEELEERLRDGNVVLIDVRPREEFEAGHIAEARSMPVDELDQLIGDLEPDREVIAYCRGPYCAYADEAVRLLQERGRRARRLDMGYPEWRHRTLPSE